MKVVFPASLGI
jgi:hypothetical protein